MENKILNLVAKFGERGGSRRTREARTDDDDLIFPLVRRVDELGVKLVAFPLFIQRTGGDVGV